MSAKFETLDDDLDDLDAIKEKAAQRTRGMSTKQVRAHYAQSARRLRELTGLKLRVRRPARKAATAKG